MGVDGAAQAGARGSGAEDVVVRRVGLLGQQGKLAQRAAIAAARVSEAIELIAAGEAMLVAAIVEQNNTVAEAAALPPVLASPPPSAAAPCLTLGPVFISRHQRAPHPLPLISRAR